MPPPAFFGCLLHKVLAVNAVGGCARETHASLLFLSRAQAAAKPHAPARDRPGRDKRAWSQGTNPFINHPQLTSPARHSRPNLLHAMRAIAPRPLVRRAAAGTILLIRPPCTHDGSPASGRAVKLQRVYTHEPVREVNVVGSPAEQ